MSVKAKAVAAGKSFLSAVGAAIVGIVAVSLVAMIVPEAAQIIAIILGIVAATALFGKINVPILRSKGWAAFGLFLALLMGVGASSSFDQRRLKLRADDPAAYLQSVKATRPDAEYMAELKALAPEAHAQEMKRRSDVAAKEAVETKARSEATAIQAKQDYIAQIKREIDGFKDFKPEDYSGSRDEAILGAALLAAWAEIYERGGEFELSPEEQALRSRFRAKAVEAQAKAFPVFRRALGKALDDALWEEDIDVTVSGSRSTTIEFVGAAYAANRNIAASQQEITGLLAQFRFKRSQYRWMKLADEFQYYSLDGSLDDRDFAVFKSGGWVKLADEPAAPTSTNTQATESSQPAAPEAVAPPSEETATEEAPVQVTP